MSAYRMGPASARAYSALKAQGMILGDRPGTDMPSIPDDLTALDDKDLMELYAVFVAWSDYAASQCACAIIDEKDAELKAASLERTAQMQWRASGKNVTDARSAAKDDPNVEAAYTAHFEAEAYRRLVESVVTRTERAAALLSRELTRRVGASAEKSRRTGGWVT